MGGGLPSEQAMSENFGVSRTVLREAISRLKAEGLVVTQQGRGVFVAANSTSLPFRLGADLADIDSILKIVELRIGFEVEAAGLAAERRTASDLVRIGAAVDEMAAAVLEHELDRGVAADVEFHSAICEATQNHNYVSFCDFLSQYMMNSIHISRYRTSRTHGLELAVQAEHEAIFSAIKSGNAEAARSAARIHIYNTGRRISGNAILGPDGQPIEPADT